MLQYMVIDGDKLLFLDVLDSIITYILNATFGRICLASPINVLQRLEFGVLNLAIFTYIETLFVESNQLSIN